MDTAVALPAADIATHERLGIEKRLLEQAQVRRVDDTEARALLCCNGRPGLMGGVVYPYLSPMTGRPVAYRVRRDYPEIEAGKPKNKYLSAAGDRRRLYFAPNAAPLLGDSPTTVVLVEAEKSVLAIASASERQDRRVLAIGLGGCWGWRGRVGKTEDARGEWVDEIGVLPDFDLVTWLDRDAVIAFDANASSNPKVQSARRALARELTLRGAKVRILDLPASDGVNGPDDYIGRYDDVSFFTLLDGATATDTGVRAEDFFAFMPAHTYIFVPTGDAWPASSVNARLAGIAPGRATGKGQQERFTPSRWLDQNRAVEQMIWAPGEPLEICDRLISNGGWVDKVGCTTLNLYRPPQRHRGKRDQAEPWIDHLRYIYPAEADHLTAWLSHRVQRPGEKINHAIVLGGNQGIGKDTLLEPVKVAIGPWNFVEVAPTHVLGRFNGFLKSVVLRVSEARDLGDVDRFCFYDHLKTLTAAPPDVLRCDEKHLREHSVKNVTGVIITTNHKTDGLYLPADDRRHYVAWSDRSKDDFTEEYWIALWQWYEDGGTHHVAAYLEGFDLAGFNPKAPPPRTPAFFDIVDANRAPEDAELADVLDALGEPRAVTLGALAAVASQAFADWLRDRRFARQIPHRMETAGYVAVHNDGAKDGLWRVDGRRQVIYARRELNIRDRLAAAGEVARR